MGEGDRTEINREVAHQPFDHLRPQPIIGGKGHTAHHRQRAGLDRPPPGAGIRRILHEALRQPADGRYAEPEQRIGRIRGVALEVAAKRPVGQRQGHRVVGTGEMIKPDRHIAVIGKDGGGRLGLRQPLRRARQACGIDQPLVRLEPRDMRIAEDRQPRRRQRRGLRRRGAHIGERLARKAVHQVEVDGSDPRLAQHRHAGGDHGERLHAADRFLHVEVEILHAQAGTVDAGGGECRHQRLVHGARIKLDGMLYDARQVEPVPQPLHQPGDALRPEQARRATAPVQVGDAPRRGFTGEQVDLRQQHLGIVVQRPGLAGRLGVAAAIGADVPAIRDMDVERDRGVTVERGQPRCGFRGTDGR